MIAYEITRASDIEGGGIYLEYTYEGTRHVAIVNVPEPMQRPVARPDDGFVKLQSGEWVWPWEEVNGEWSNSYRQDEWLYEEHAPDPIERAHTAIRFSLFVLTGSPMESEESLVRVPGRIYGKGMYEDKLIGRWELEDGSYRRVEGGEG